MASNIRDRWLWLGLGVFTFFAVKGVAYGLREIVRLTEVKERPPTPISLPPTASEDAIKTESLAVLATCNNIEIRKAATKLICDRFFRNPSARKLLIEDFNSSDPDRRDASVKALKLLDANGLLNDILPPEFSNLPFTTESLPLPLRGVRARAHGESTADQELRRRRREAIVINEGDRPVSQDDIIQQGGRTSDGEETRRAEQLLARLIEGERASDAENHGELVEDEELEELLTALINHD